jgi:hypothetical protein
MTIDQIMAVDQARQTYIRRDMELTQKFPRRDASDISSDGYFESWFAVFDAFLTELAVAGVEEFDSTYRQLAQELGLEHSWMSDFAFGTQLTSAQSRSQ